MTPRRVRQESGGLGKEAPGTAALPERDGVRGALRRSHGRLNIYGGEFRVARAVLDVFAGLDPGAVRLAQTLLGLIPSRRDGGAFRTRGSAR
jgi:hypothetical protein